MTRRRVDPAPAVVEYIRQNRHRYTRRAIDERLLDSGVRLDDVEAAWSLVTERDGMHTRGEWVRFYC